MRRMATSDFQLSDGMKINRGTSMMVSCHSMWDPAIYSDPHTFDPYRFLKLREVPGWESSFQLVSPSPAHMGFGLGNQACPGRFFAANEVKIALSHMLLRYDFKLREGVKPRVRQSGTSLSADAEAEIAIRRRMEEIIL